MLNIQVTSSHPRLIFRRARLTPDNRILPADTVDCAISSRDYALDTDRRELRRGSDVVRVTAQVFDLLAYLIRNRDRVVSKDELIAAIWDGRIVSDSALTTRLNVVRNAIGDSGEQQRLLKDAPAKGFPVRRCDTRR